MQNNSAQAQKEKEIAALKKRSCELDALIEKLYEDYVQGLLNIERMEKMLNKYEAQSKAIAEQLNALQKDNVQGEKENSLRKLKKLLDKIINPTVLSSELIYRLIDHIEIGQGTYQKTNSQIINKQSIIIFFRFSGTPVTGTYTK